MKTNKTVFNFEMIATGVDLKIPHGCNRPRSYNTSASPQSLITSRYRQQPCGNIHCLRRTTSHV